MKCNRCGTPMSIMPFYEIGDSCQSWHCLICGHTTDPTIEANRKASLPPLPMSQRGENGVVVRWARFREKREGR